MDGGEAVSCDRDCAHADKEACAQGDQLRLATTSRCSPGYARHRHASGRNLPYALGACEVGPGSHLRSSFEVPQIEAQCRDDGARQSRFVGAQGRSERGLGFSLGARHIGPLETVQKQFDRAKRLAGIPASIVLYCARHRFSTDAMEGTGNLMAVMDAMGHSKMDVTRLYQHPGTKQIRDAEEKSVLPFLQAFFDQPQHLTRLRNV